MAITHGMNIEEVRSTGQELQRQSETLQNLINTLQQKVEGTTWVGPDSERFKNDWWPKHKQTLVNMVQELHGLGQSALNNASEQEQISSK